MHAQLGMVFQITVRGEGRGISSLQWRGNQIFYLGRIFFTQWKELEECFWLFEWNDLFPGGKTLAGYHNLNKKIKSYKLFKTEMSLIHERSLDKYCISQASTRVKKLHYKTKSNTKENQLSMVITVSLSWLHQFGQTCPGVKLMKIANDVNFATCHRQKMFQV